MKQYQLFIGGRHVDAVKGQWFDTVNPYTGEAWARIPRGTEEDVNAAVAAASKALKEGPWATMSATARGKLMHRLGDLVLENAQRLAELEVRDNGKLLTEMVSQLRYHPEWWWYFAGLADKIEGAVVPLDKPDAFAFTTHEPVGVVAALTAWNSPLLFVAMKCAPALAAGCTVVLKPSEFASASTLEYMELTKQAGFPDGVFNVVTGLGPEAGAALVSHPGVAKVSFTGSDATGAKIYASAAASIKRVSLELGGKSPNIIFEDCDIDAAVVGAVSGIFGATGQTCVAGSRLLVQNSVKDRVVKQLTEMARAARIGDPMQPETNIGPITTPDQYRKVLRYIDIARSEGGRCVLGGEPAPDLPGGQFVQPTIFVDITNNMRIAQEEVFGPVLSVIGFEDEADAIRIGNDVIYGLAAGVWTKDLARALRMSKALKAGTVFVNTYRGLSCTLPFGGMKHSGLGRENGIESVREFLETKSTWISISTAKPANPFIMRL
jgi:acyl-CoA reductase-like NAD-dependent aldehyde dehydrogenase